MISLNVTKYLICLMEYQQAFTKSLIKMPQKTISDFLRAEEIPKSINAADVSWLHPLYKEYEGFPRGYDCISHLLLKLIHTNTPIFLKVDNERLDILAEIKWRSNGPLMLLPHLMIWHACYCICTKKMGMCFH